jgi:hypothetical protein
MSNSSLLANQFHCEKKYIRVKMAHYILLYYYCSVIIILFDVEMMENVLLIHANSVPFSYNFCKLKF